RKMSIFLFRKNVEPDERQENCPGNKIEKSLRNVPDPAQKLKIGSCEPPGELVRPLRCYQGAARCLRERNRPRRENPDHDQEPDKMGRMKKCLPASSLPKHRDDDA